MNDFQTTFGHPPQVTAHAPGRVNLIGEHTDYNDGFVLPIAIEQAATVMISFSHDSQHHLVAPDTGERYDLMPDAKLEGLAKYVLGCYRVLEEHFKITVPPLNYWVRSTVPTGSGLSSSAAIEVATLRAVRELLNLELDDVKLAQLGQRAENVWVGVPCGIMDQMASSVANTQTALFLDTLTLEMRSVSLPAGSEILVIHSGVSHELSDGGYAERRAQCEEASRLLGLKSLRFLTDWGQLSTLEGKLKKRARHVVTENDRVLRALESDAGHFGILMNESHSSLRDDYGVSVRAVDDLVEILQAQGGVYGARMTGGGFGGCVVVLVKAGRALEVGRRAVEQHRALGYAGRQVVPPLE